MYRRIMSVAGPYRTYNDGHKLRDCGTVNDVTCLSLYVFVAVSDCHFFNLHLAGLYTAQPARFPCFAPEYDEICAVGLFTAQHAVFRLICMPLGWS